MLRMSKTIQLAAKIGLILCAVSLHAQLITITGTLNGPDGTPLTGQIQVSLVRPTNVLQNTCASPVQVLNFKTVFVQVVAGAVTPFNLYATSCLNPSTLYLARVFDSMQNLLYTANWTVPNAASSGGGSTVAWSTPVTQTWSSMSGTWANPGGSGSGGGSGGVDITWLDQK